MPRKPTGRPPGRPKPAVPTEAGVKPDLPEWCSRAVEVELEFYEIGREPWPSTASVGQVARAAGVTRKTIRDRRKCPLYRALLEWRYRKWRLEWLEAELAEDDKREDEEREDAGSWWSKDARRRIADMSADEAERYLRWSTRRWARRHWHQRELRTGPIVHLDPRSYATPGDWADALVAAGHYPTEEPEAPIG
jgi:hypothetical protein